MVTTLPLLVDEETRVTATLRRIIDPPLDGPTNMARDEALLLAVGQKRTPPTLRFYRWDPPTISLGYFQTFAEYEALDFPARNCPVVRRLTGGGAILHADELTYSLALPLGHSLVGSNLNDLYLRMHEAAIAALADLGIHAARCGTTVETHAQRGPFFCFQRRHCLDVLVGNDKIVGSAQRRIRDAVLQHGSIILDAPFPQQKSFAGRAVNDDVLGRIISAIQRNLGVNIEEGSWSTDEKADAEKLRDKYLDPAWTKRR